MMPTSLNQKRIAVLETFGFGMTSAHVKVVCEDLFPYTSKHLAQLIGVSQQTLSRWLLTAARPSQAHRRLLWLMTASQALQTTPPAQWPSVWHLLEQLAMRDAFYAVRPKSKPPTLDRNRDFYRTRRYVELCVYQPTPGPDTLAGWLQICPLSQVQLSHLLGVTQPTLSNWLSGKSYPTGTHAKLFYLLVASPLIFEEQTTIEAMLEWMAVADGNPAPQQPHWMYWYHEYPLEYPADTPSFVPSTQRAKRYLEEHGHLPTWATST